MEVTLLDAYFDFFYAQEIMDKMASVFKNKCFGCQTGCLSQLDHACLTLPLHQKLDLYFEEVLSEVDEMDIQRKWNASVSTMEDTSPELVEMFKLKICCLDWRETEMKSPAWKARMIKLTQQLLSLEKCF
jgi:hypothetical protein